jgi:hypothetical protein
MRKFRSDMNLAVVSIFLFCMIFVLAIPMKRENDKLADLISLERALEDSISKVRYDLSLVEISIDSLSSRNRIDSVAPSFGLGANGIATKIAEREK